MTLICSSLALILAGILLVTGSARALKTDRVEHVHDDPGDDRR